MYKYFNEELLSIQDKEIRDKTIEVLEEVSEKFFIAPASSSGKYHPDFALGEGGLYRHTKAAVKIANILFEFTGKNFSETLKDYIRAALILHDCCKSGKDWEYEHTCHEHPLLACEFIETIVGQCEYSQAVNNLIKSHMGQWTTNKRSKIVLPAPSSNPQEFVHVCDYLASRKFIEINFEEV